MSLLNDVMTSIQVSGILGRWYVWSLEMEVANSLLSKNDMIKRGYYDPG
jgi:hypothetical protein